ncbi:ABA4-like family protein [Altererythrobacter sp.]|nr:ABA4-like family protein [Altererythrobacter sp.]
MWATIFSSVNMLALAGWLILVLAPRKPLPLTIVLYIGVGILCLLYSAGLIWVLAGSGGSGMDFGSIEGVRSIFATDSGVTIGWTHYLAFDLFVGLWIARDADAKDFSRWLQAPILFITLIAGPLGLLLWLLIRETRRAPRSEN